MSEQLGLPGFGGPKSGWGALLRRKRKGRYDEERIAEFELLALRLLIKCGVCRPDNGAVRCVADDATGRLVVMAYLEDYDHAAWTLERHVEHYLMRHFKGAMGVDLHSVHLSVRRERAFREAPPPQSSAQLREALRTRRLDVASTDAPADTAPAPFDPLSTWGSGGPAMPSVPMPLEPGKPMAADALGAPSEPASMDVPLGARAPTTRQRPS